MVNGYMTTALVILGTIGNVHGVKRVQVTNLDKRRGIVLAVSLIALAIWDTILLWCAFFYYAIRKLPLAVSTDWLNVLMPWFHPFSNIANTAAVSYSKHLVVTGVDICLFGNLYPTPFLE
ncbi:unnamed protein product [Cylicostephanus goldi]|uniref:Uncharacterized protein n=1 Tax=Cylicostephanus goldi TaxID=71465 RepID=A0A3P7MZU6_CYLGO|nr:unnamed protein product [Cylicostephanus goldi]